MDKILENFGDNRVQSVILYVNAVSADDTYIYEDEARTIKVKREVVEELYLKGMLKICTRSGEYAIPVVGEDYDGKFTVYLYVTSSGGGIAVKSFKAE